MFKILADDKLIWLPNNQQLKLLSPTLNLEVNKVGSLSFKILPNHRYFGELEKMKTIISVVQDNRVVFKGRVYSDGEDFRRIKTIQVEGILGYLNDSVVRPYDFTGSPEEYFKYLISQHNNQVEEYQRFNVGRVTVVDNNDYITRSSTETPKTWSELENKLINNLGGYIVVRYEEDGNYIDYLADYEDTSKQSIAFAVNLLDISTDTKGETLATCIIPYGKADDETGERVDITSVNNGLDYICDDTAVARYGRIYEVVIFDDVTLPENLLTKARQYLADKIKLTTQITIKALDLHLSDETIEAFKLGDYVRVYSKPHDIDDKVLVTSYNMDLTKPAECVITLGLEKSSFVKTSNNTIAIKRELEKTFKKEYVSMTKFNQGNEETAETIKELAGKILTTNAITDMIYPVGSIYMTATLVNPAELFGGKWTRIEDTFLLSAGSTYKAGATGGSATHTLTADEIPAHNHSAGTLEASTVTGHAHSLKNSKTKWGTSIANGVNSVMVDSNEYTALSNKNTNTAGEHGHSITGSTGSKGGGKAHNNMPPYLAVYVWKRTE